MRISVFERRIVVIILMHLHLTLFSLSFPFRHPLTSPAIPIVDPVCCLTTLYHHPLTAIPRSVRYFIKSQHIRYLEDNGPMPLEGLALTDKMCKVMREKKRER